MPNNMKHAGIDLALFQARCRLLEPGIDEVLKQRGDTWEDFLSATLSLYTPNGRSKYVRRPFSGEAELWVQYYKDKLAKLL